MARTIKYFVNFYLTVCAFVLPAALTHAQQPDNEQALSVGVAWESKYVAEGRDKLGDGGIYTFDPSLAVSGFIFGAWLGSDDTVSYQELKLSAEYGHTVASFDLYAGYTRVKFLRTDEGDNEFSAGAAYNELPWLVPAIDYVYSTDAKAAFVEVSLRSDILLLEERLTLFPYVTQAIDYGFATQEHDGANNLQFGLKAKFALNKNMELHGFITRSLAQRDVELEGGGDLTWGGIGLS